MTRYGLSLAMAAALAAPPTGRAPVVRGLDHVPIAVADLDAAARRYQALGFTLKPGRPHANGIRNLHAKFADGTELELITAPEARDALTTTYRRHLSQGDGPAFLALFAPDADEATALAEGDVVLLPADRQLVPGRKVVGVTLRVTAGRGASVFVAPDRTHGVWIEFRHAP